MSKLLKYEQWVSLNEAANGQLSPSEVTPIPTLPTEKAKHSLNPEAAAAYTAMVKAAAESVPPVSWGITDSYRPLEVQKRLAKQKGLYSQGGLAAAPGTSNHGWGSAVDLKVKKGDAAHKWLTDNAAKFGFSTIPREPWHWEHKESAKKMRSGQPSTVTTNEPDTSGTSSTSNSTSNQEIKGKTPGEKILNNQIILNWLFNAMPDLAPTLTPQQLDRSFSEKPEHFKWFKEKFGLDDSGNPTGSPKISESPSDTKKASDAIMASSKIKSKYSGQAAQNIDLLVNELQANGVTNKYAIIGILSTIGKESGFLPRNEVSYANTGNRRIRKIFGSRVKDLTEDQLTELKKNPVKFWDRVYGSDDPTGRSQKMGNSQPGDGAKYLGRGFNGITFKSGYEKYGKLLGIDLVSDPDKLNDPTIAAKAAVAYFLGGLKKLNIDPNSFTNKRDAIKKFVQLNAGMGVNIEGSETLAAAEKVSNNFDVA